VPQPYVAAYYAQRVRSAGLIIAEVTQRSFIGQGCCRTPGIDTPQQIEAWRTVTDRVAQNFDAFSTDGPSASLDKAWHATHYLITGIPDLRFLLDSIQFPTVSETAEAIADLNHSAE
jgi:NADH:flavin oxidoreductase / NADH oxidase family